MVSTAVAQSSTNAPIFQYAAFFNLDLDLSPGQAMTMNGKVHVNGNFWMYPQAAATFNNTVEATMWVTNADNPNDQQNLSYYTAPTYNGGAPLSRVGRLNMLINTTNVEAMLNLPPAGLGVPNDAGYMPSNQIYLYNECDLIISNSVTGTNGNGVFNTNLSVFYDDYNNSPRLTRLPNDLQWTNLVMTYVSLLQPSGKGPMPPTFHFVGEQQFQELRMGKFVPLGISRPFRQGGQ